MNNDGRVPVICLYILSFYPRGQLGLSFLVTREWYRIDRGFRFLGDAIIGEIAHHGGCCWGGEEHTAALTMSQLLTPFSPAGYLNKLGSKDNLTSLTSVSLFVL